MTPSQFIKQTRIGILPNFETQQNNVLQKCVAMLREL
jgi:hypothetical protein